MNWDSKTQDKFKVFLSKMPVFHRRIAEEAVSKKAEENAAQRLAQEVNEQDVVNAFFSDVPKPFYSMMVRLLDEAGFEYRKYGFPQS